MGSFLTIQNPETAKRIRRFKSNRLAYVSLWVLAVLYLISLFSELVCNSDPLFVRHNGRYYFPIFSYTPEDVFLNNGKQTRPDYKKLARLPEFTADPANIMVFPPLMYGPFESVPVDELTSGKNVRLVLSPERRIATVNLRPDNTVSRSSSFGTLTGTDENGILDTPVTDYFTLPTGLKDALALRFANTDAPEFSCSVNWKDGAVITVTVNAFTARDEAPKTVRLKFEENEGDTRKPVTVTFDKDLSVDGTPPDLWSGLSRENRAMLTEKVGMRFDRPVDSITIDTPSGIYRADFDKQDIRFPFPPCTHHPMGLDEAGRDVLARILYGLRISLTFGLILVVFSMGLGICAGAVQGYYGGFTDITGQRLIEIWSALPFLYIMILMGSVYGRSFSLLLFCYGIFNWIGISYYVRAEFLRLRRQAFVEAAKCMAIPTWKIIFKHIMPNAMVPVITFFPFSLVGAIGSLASLDYLGVGLPPPTPSWGELLSQAQQYTWAWWLILYPSMALFIVMLLGVFIGEGVRNAYDPKQYFRLQ
jgi:microcin C transport system permease protein